MAVDNRTELNDCEQDAGWNGTDNPDLQGVSSGDEVYYEGSNCLGAQFTNTQEYIIVGENSTGTALNENLSTSTVWLLVKDNLIETQTNGGFQIVLANGTGGGSAIIGFYVGGNDNPGLVLGKTYYCIRLDVSNIGSLSSFAHNGTLGNLNTSAVTDIGYGSLHVTAARGNVNNLWVDRITSNPNNSYAFTVNAGTSGTPITLATLVSQDNTNTNGWGLFASGPGESYTLYASTEFGDSGTADSYFESSNEQIFLDGTGIGSGNWIFRVFGNATGTNSFVLDNSVLASPGEGAIWDMTDTNIDILDIKNCTILDMGTMSFPVSGGTTRQVTGTTFIGCGQLDFATITASDITISTTTAQATGAILLDTDGQTTNQTDFNFIATTLAVPPATRHAVYITQAGDYTFTRWTFSGYGSGSAAAVYNVSGGTVNITVVDGDTPTVLNDIGSTTNIISKVTLTLTGMKDGTEVRVFDSNDTTPPYAAGNEIAFVEELSGGAAVGGDIGGTGANATAGGTTDNNTFAFDTDKNATIFIRVFNENFITTPRLIQITPSASQEVQITQSRDRTFSNP